MLAGEDLSSEAQSQPTEVTSLEAQRQSQNQAQVKLAFLINNLGLTAFMSSAVGGNSSASTAFGVLPKGLRHYQNPWGAHQAEITIGKGKDVASSQIESTGTHELKLERLGDLQAAEAAQCANRGWSEKATDSLNSFFYGTKARGGRPMSLKMPENSGKAAKLTKIATSAVNEARTGAARGTEAQKEQMHQEAKTQREQQKVAQDQAQHPQAPSLQNLDASDFPDVMTPSELVHPKVLEQRNKILEKEKTIHQTLEMMEHNRAAHLIPSRHSVCSDEMQKVAVCYNRANVAEGQFYQSVSGNGGDRADGKSAGWFAKAKPKVIASDTDLLLGKLTLACAPDVVKLTRCAEKTSVKNLSE